MPQKDKSAKMRRLSSDLSLTKDPKPSTSTCYQSAGKHNDGNNLGSAFSTDEEPAITKNTVKMSPGEQLIHSELKSKTIFYFV